MPSQQQQQQDRDDLLLLSDDENDNDYDFYMEAQQQQAEEQHQQHQEQSRRYQQQHQQQERLAVPEQKKARQSQHQQIQSIQPLITNCEWKKLTCLIEIDPDVCRLSVHMVVMGENVTCLPLHAAVGRWGAGLPVIDCLVTAHPAALLQKDKGGDRLPLHIALLKGASMAVIRYLMEALPVSLEKADCDGNLPLHYAAMYSSEKVIRLLADRSPAACRHANGKERMPLHLLCARNWDEDMLSLSIIDSILMRHPSAVQHADRTGCLPLHVACSQPSPRWDVLKLLVTTHTDSLLHKNNAGHGPLQITRRITCIASSSSVSAGFSAFQSHFNNNDNDVVLAYLRDKTNQVKRKSLMEKIFAIRISR
jgi:hypothetical protein